MAASLQAPVLFTIAQDLRDMQVEAAIDEADVGRLRVGQAASFTVDAFPRRNFTGEIRQIRKSPVNVQNVISYTVVISAANPDMSLLPGMTANVRVVVDSRDNVLKVAERRAALPARAARRDAKPRRRRAGAAGGRRRRRSSSAQRIFDELKPDDAQKAKLEQIFDDVAAEDRAACATCRRDGERRTAGERHARRDRARVADDPHAPRRAGLRAPAGRDRRRARRRRRPRGRLCVPGRRRSPRPWTCALGLTDGTSTEIPEGPLKEGDEVILGAGEARAARRRRGRRPAARSRMF